MLGKIQPLTSWILPLGTIRTAFKNNIKMDLSYYVMKVTDKSGFGMFAVTDFGFTNVETSNFFLVNLLVVYLVTYFYLNNYWSLIILLKIWAHIDPLIQDYGDGGGGSTFVLGHRRYRVTNWPLPIALQLTREKQGACSFKEHKYYKLF